jgi:hypothetical protein
MELPILLNKQPASATWTEMLEQITPQWKAAATATDTREILEAKLRMLQLLHGFRRAGQSIDEREAGRLVLQPDNPLHQSEPAGRLRAARLISASAQNAEANLTQELLTKTYAAITDKSADEAALRRTETSAISPSHNPLPAVLLPGLIDNALEWFAADSFNELHIVEKAALVFLRLLDLQPFPSHHETIASLAASFYLERADLPPLIIFADEFNATRWPAIMEAGFQMNTQPLVNFLAENLVRTIQMVLSE